MLKLKLTKDASGFISTRQPKHQQVYEEVIKSDRQHLLKNAA